MGKKIQVGDIVSIVEKGYAFGKVGRVIPFPGTVDGRIPVMFPKFVAPRWFNRFNCILALKKERKKYFLEILKHGQ